ncbi:hypothetical protein [Baaleninema simplex]|uniref:hypothetical protein n=1 Tax=Baaleninema simplex TaxID=2862350 RepID=UPI00034C8C9C|nr:hypothetical protein [Baaleninema simplex]
MTPASPNTQSGNGVRGLLKSLLWLLTGLVSALNTLPYQRATLIFGNAALDGQTGLLAAFFRSPWGELLLAVLGLTLWAALQLAEMLPILTTSGSRRFSRQVSFVAYGVDVAILSAVYRIFDFPPNWLDVTLFVVALFAVEAVVYVAQKV